MRVTKKELNAQELAGKLDKLIGEYGDVPDYKVMDILAQQQKLARARQNLNRKNQLSRIVEMVQLADLSVSERLQLLEELSHEDVFSRKPLNDANMSLEDQILFKE